LPLGSLATHQGCPRRSWNSTRFGRLVTRSWSVACVNCCSRVLPRPDVPSSQHYLADGGVLAQIGGDRLDLPPVPAASRDAIRPVGPQAVGTTSARRRAPGPHHRHGRSQRPTGRPVWPHLLRGRARPSARPELSSLAIHEHDCISSVPVRASKRASDSRRVCSASKWAFSRRTSSWQED